MSNEIALELQNVHLTYPVRKSSPKSIKRLFSIFSRRKDEVTSTLKDIKDRNAYTVACIRKILSKVVLKIRQHCSAAQPN